MYSNQNNAFSQNLPTILIAAPVRDREKYLPHYLKHIYNLNYPKHLISILWVVNQSTDRSEQLLKEFKKKYQDEYKNIQIEKYNGSKIIPKDARITQIRVEHTYSHLAELRSYILSKIGDNNYLFSCDSDILVKPDCLIRLVLHQKDVCASVIYNGYRIDKENPWKYPNVLKMLADGSIEHIANAYIKKSPMLTESKLIKCDVTGAVYLISNRVATSGAKYRFHPQGEDIPFCLDVKKRGFEIYADAGVYSQHLMDEQMIDTYSNF